MVSGSVHLKNFAGRRNFVQTFFLAPQEKGYFVLNDIFHFIDDDQLHQHPAVLLAHSTFDSKLSAPTTIPEPGLFTYFALRLLLFTLTFRVPSAVRTIDFAFML